MSDILTAARHYAEAGLSVIPVRVDGSKAPDLPTWKPFQERRPTPEELGRWFGHGARHGIATVCGAVSGNLLKLDFDAPGMYESFEAVCVGQGFGDLLAAMPLIETPSGGRHLDLRCSGPVPGNQKLAQRLVEVPEGTDGARPVDGRWVKVKTLIETRGEGGYTLAPGSPSQCHPSGRPYRYLRGRPSTIPTITAEELSVLLALAATLNEYAEPERLVEAPRPARPSAGEGLRPGDDYNRRGDYESVLERHGFRLKGHAGDKGLWQRPGKDGRGISATSNYAGSNLFYVFSSNAAPFEAERAYSPFAVYTLLEHGGDYPEAARALGRQGYGDQTPPEARREIQAARREGLSAAGPGDPPQDAPPGTPIAGAGPEPLPLTETGLGQRLAHRHGRDLRYSYEMARWFVWDGRRWARDITGEIDRRAKDTARAIFKEAADCPDEAKRAEIAKYALQAQRLAKRQGMIVDARSEPGIPVAVADFDKNPWLLTCENGTLNLKTGRLHPSRREDLITKRAPVAYDPDAACPRWEKFLARVLPDPDVRAYVQRAVGYMLTGSVSEQCLFFLHGGGQNGKSTLLGTLLTLMGDYGLQAAPDLLIAKENAGGPNNEVAELQGARFVATIEVEDGKRMAEGLVKQITGGDRIKARFMRQDFFEFEPSHKIFLAANHKPTIRGNDHAIWRRIKMVPFDVQIPDAEKDPLLPDKLRAELPGVLAWAVRGCLEWQRNGLAEPAAVKAATDEYRQEQDVLGDFLAECCVLRPALTVTAAALYQTYTEWCEKNSERPLGKKSFSQRLREQAGIHPATGIGPKAVRGWQGIGLRDRHDYSGSDSSDTSDKESPICTKKKTHEALIPETVSEMSETSADTGDWEVI